MTTEEQNKQDMLDCMMAMVRIGWNQAFLHISDALKEFPADKVPVELYDVLIDALNSDKKRKFAYEMLEKELKEIKEERQPSCSKDPNTCQVAFCNWNKCLLPFEGTEGPKTEL